MSTVITLSGGMDSTVLAHWVTAGRASDDRDLALSFDYGQRHRKELVYAEATAAALGFDWQAVDLSSITGLIGGSALTDDVEVPDGHYAADTMAATVVPNRNMMMLSVAVAAAVARGATSVVTATHAGDHFVYPDCRPEFIKAVDVAATLGTLGFHVPGFAVTAPFVNRTKTEIAELGATLGVDWLTTWSCYKGGEVHCGRCGTCVERREAFRDAGVEDPTPYADMDFAWAALASAVRMAP